jgi:hypothetical protein
MPRPDRQTHKYDAFLSYSHGGDNAVSARLQSGLQKLAKRPLQPWAVRVFRDETNLTASPGFWPRIKAALDQSRYFILLASPDSAQSGWVAKEICHWLTAGRTDDSASNWADQISEEHAARTLIALSGGVIRWNRVRGDFDWDHTTALPSLLSHIFSEEPLWIDLRPPNTEIKGLDEVDFTRALARLSVPIRFGARQDLADRAKELLDRDYVEHKKSIRRFRMAACVFAVLSLLVAGAGIYANSQRGQAVHQGELATKAQAAAERQAGAARRAQAAAEQQARISLARQLAAQSGQMRVDDPFRLELSLLLGIEAVRREWSFESDRALRDAIALSAKAIVSFRHESSVRSVVFSPNGRYLATVVQKEISFEPKGFRSEKP